jgi:membrane protein YdbS with pleckstrin-like domain
MDNQINQNCVEIINSKLYPCPDCASLISKRAEVCPKCGAPLAPAVSNTPASKPFLEDISKEQTVDIYRPSSMNYFWLILLGIILIPAILGIIILLWIIIEITCTRYELTTHRIIVRRGLISKTQNEIWIKDMRGVNLFQGLWQRIIGVGDIAVGTAATAGAEISIAGVAKPAEIVDKINSLRHS